jgi:hypothetical protein
MTLKGGKELFDDGAGGSRNDLQCDKVRTLSTREEVHNSYGSFGIGVPDVQSVTDRQARSVDSTLAGVGVRYSPSTWGSEHCGRLPLKVGIWRSTHWVANDFPD